MHPAQLQALAMLTDQLFATAQHQLQTAQRLKTILTQGAQLAQARPQPPVPQMQSDYLNGQEEAVLGAAIAQAQQQAAAADGNDMNSIVGALEAGMGALPHFQRPRQRAQQGGQLQQQRAPMQQPGGFPNMGAGGFDPFAGMMDAMGGFGG